MADDFDDDLEDTETEETEDLPLEALDDEDIGDPTAEVVDDDVDAVDDDVDDVADEEDDEDEDEDEEAVAKPTDDDDVGPDLDDDDDEEAEETLEVLLDPEEVASEKKRAKRKRGAADATVEATNPAGEGEFTCRSCFLVKRRAQLADPEAMICVDCA